MVAAASRDDWYLPPNKIDCIHEMPDNRVFFTQFEQIGGDRAWLS